MNEYCAYETLYNPSFPNERFVDINNIDSRIPPDSYFISDHGWICRAKLPGREIYKGFLDKNNPQMVRASINLIDFKIANLVAKAFITNPNNLSRVLKIDKTDPFNLHYTNLYWDGVKTISSRTIEELPPFLESPDFPDEKFVDIYDISKNHWKVDEGTYYITSKGRLYNMKKNTFLNVNKNSNGYLCGSVKDSLVTIHRLVALAFIPNPNNYEQVDHLRTKLDNGVNDLEWVTGKENIVRNFERGYENPEGIKSSRAFFSNEDLDILFEKFKNKISFRALEKEYGISRSQFSRILSRKTYQTYTSDKIKLCKELYDYYTDFKSGTNSADAKFTKETLDLLFEDLKLKNSTYSELAKKYGLVKGDTIGRIVRRKAYKEYTEDKIEICTELAQFYST